MSKFQLMMSASHEVQDYAAAAFPRP